MAAAIWPQPPRDGVTLWHITDTHMSYRANFDWSRTHAVEAGNDLTESLIANVHGRLHTGDIVDGPGSTTHPDGFAKTWLTENLGGPQDIWVPGNHDLVGPLGGFTNPPRSRADWESVYGRPALSNTLIPGAGGANVRVITLCPDLPVWETDTSWTIPPATMAWLDSELSAHSEPTWIACHYLLHETGMGGSGDIFTYPEAELVDLISAHPHVIGWLAGHTHRGITRTDMAQALPVGNRSAFPVIAGPSATFAPGLGYDRAGVSHSLFVTFRDTDRIEIRYRDHGSRKWVTGANGARVYVLNPS